MNKKYTIRFLATFALGVGGLAGWWLQTHETQWLDKPMQVLKPDVSSSATMTQARADVEFRQDKPQLLGLPNEPNGLPKTVHAEKAWVPQQQSVSAATREAASTFRQGQNNAFFDEASYARSFAANGGQGVENLRNELRNTAALEALPEDVDFFKDAPEAVLDRMAMIDMLGTIAKDDDKALDALVEIATSPLDASLPPHVIRALVGEKYDAFAELARHDWKAASSAFSVLDNDKLKEAMRPALVGGLVDSGTPNEEAVRMVQAI